MDTQELLVHDRRQRQRAERFNASLVDLLVVFVLTLEFECKIIRKVSALMVPSQEPQCVRVPNLQGPKIQNALEKKSDPYMHAIGIGQITNLNAKITSVDIVTQEQVSCLRGVAADFEQFH